MKVIYKASKRATKEKSSKLIKPRINASVNVRNVVSVYVTSYRLCIIIRNNVEGIKHNEKFIYRFKYMVVIIPFYRK